MKIRFRPVRVWCLAASALLPLLVGPPSVRGELPVKALVDLWRDAGRKQEEAVAKTEAARISPETVRKLQERDLLLKRLQHADLRPASLDLATMAWKFADKTTQDRAKAEAATLEEGLKKEAEKISEEEKLDSECAEKMAGALRQSVCDLVRAKATGDQPLDADALTTGAELNATKVSVICLSNQAAHRVAEAANSRAADVVETVVKTIGDHLADRDLTAPPPTPEMLDTKRRNQLLLIAYALCNAE